MKYTFIILSFIFTYFLNASLPLRIPLEKLVKNTDHILTGYVIGVDMVDGKGNQITDLKARTGPGLKNKIRLIIKVHKVHLTSEKTVPEKLAVPLDSFMHYRFGQIKQAHSLDGKKFLVLLKGKDFQPPFSGVFARSLDEKAKILKMKNKVGISKKVDIVFKHKPLKNKVNYSCPTYVDAETCQLLIKFQMRD